MIELRSFCAVCRKAIKMLLPNQWEHREPDHSHYPVPVLIGPGGESSSSATASAGGGGGGCTGTVGLGGSMSAYATGGVGSAGPAANTGCGAGGPEHGGQAAGEYTLRDHQMLSLAKSLATENRLLRETLLKKRAPGASVERLTEIRNRLQEATPGPWAGINGWSSIELPNGAWVPTRHKDCEFMLHAPSDVAFLLETVEALLLGDAHEA